MTLIEMLVSITILTVMILTFSSVLVQSQKFISVAQASRRSHQVAASLARIIRRDIRQITQNGFLTITAASDGSPLLIATIAGSAHSITDLPTKATAQYSPGSGSLICYGQVDNAAPEYYPNTQKQQKWGEILWRPSYVLVDVPGRAPNQPPAPLQGGAGLDALDIGLSYIQSVPRQQDPNGGLAMDQVVDGISGLHGAVNVRIPVNEEFGNIKDLWQVLAQDVDGLSIMWTDGETDDLDPNDQQNQDLNWYGIDATGPKGWLPVRAADPKLFPVNASKNYDTPGGIEDKTANGGKYRALWTHEDQTNWPKLVKFRFRIRDRNMPPEFRQAEGLYYEVICSVGR